MFTILRRYLCFLFGGKCENLSVFPQKIILKLILVEGRKESWCGEVFVQVEHFWVIDLGRAERM